MNGATRWWVREREKYGLARHDATTPAAASWRRGQGNLCSSTRRFWARPAAVAFDATGLDGPNPRATMRDGAIPLRARYARTAMARARDSRVFTAAEPVLSV